MNSTIPYFELDSEDSEPDGRVHKQMRLLGSESHGAIVGNASATCDFILRQQHGVPFDDDFESFLMKDPVHASTKWSTFSWEHETGRVTGRRLSQGDSAGQSQLKLISLLKVWRCTAVD